MRRLPTTTVFMLYQASNGFLFRLLATVFNVFLIVELHLTPFQLLLMGTCLEGSYLLFELPTGIVADTVGRKVSVVIGVAGVGVSFILLGLSTSFAMAAASQILFGVFATFESGADYAWLTDEIGEEAAHEYYLKGEQMFQALALVGIVGSVVLARAFELRTPIVIAGIGTIALAVILVFTMHEEHYHPAERAPGETLASGLRQTLRDGIAEVRAHHALLLILAVAALHGASTEGFDRLGDFHFLKDIGLPFIGTENFILWFGLIDGVALILGIGAIQVVKRRTRLEGHVHVAKILGGIDIALVLGAVAFAFAGEFWLALIAFWIVGGLRNVREPIFRAWVNQGLEAKTRATINSMATQADAIGQAAGGPMLGVAASAISVPAALAISGLLRLPALLLYGRAIRRGTVGTVTPSDETLEIEE
jgi:DHA3 family tetracycline resistance protein-like MFS transporter